MPVASPRVVVSLPRGGSDMRVSSLLSISVLVLGCRAINDTDEFLIARAPVQPAPLLEPDAGPPERPRPIADCRNEIESLRCNGAVPEFCSGSGEWEVAGEACAFGCLDGACTQCQPDSRSCAEGSAVPRLCSALGRWMNLEPCAADSPVCMAGQCGACIAGERRCSAEGIPQACGAEGAWRDEGACPAGQVCVPATAACGECSEGETRACLGAIGNCALGIQRCEPGSTWSACSVTPDEDSCLVGDDASCDGVPNTPSTGRCECTENEVVACGSPTDLGECSRGTSVCVGGALGACEGAIAPAARDCRSPLDNDCDGAPDDAIDATCECRSSDALEACPVSYPLLGICRAPQRRCLASANGQSSQYSDCEGGVEPAARDCTSSQDNDCDGRADAESCDCRAGEVRACGSDSCSGTQVCVLSDDLTRTFFGECELPTDWTFDAPELVGGLASAGDLWGPSAFEEGRSLVFGASDTEEDLFIATRTDRGTSFSLPRALAALNTAASEGTPFVSADASTLYFYSNRSGGVGGRDIWFATADGSGAFEDPALLGNVNTAAEDQSPWLSSDGLSLFFDSTRAGGSGQQDLWLAERATRTSAFRAPINLSELNTSGFEEGPSLSRDSLAIFFASNRPGGEGDLDIWLATRRAAGNAFAAPRPVAGLNSSAMDLDPALTPDDRELFFSSFRDGQQLLYRAVRRCD
jgi:hypothetical protein